MEISKRDQRIAADIITALMFTKTMDDVMNVCNDMIVKYDLCSDSFTQDVINVHNDMIHKYDCDFDPFTHTPVIPEEFAENMLDYF